ncbi:hypothetical protein [Nocardia huaxiensis]|uniref:hypothetical protein n=1 Tax=Nocardia huaxiensis TaxID=2755382 RepID=UPI001E5344CC|nr:hypothetical protein [Nocardia huaxiensis]UFS97022.1 hypothetical protein LPY97_03555 [Nocardia huaxiensis]
MATIRNSLRVTLVSAAAATAVIASAAPAFAANSIDVTGIGPANVGVDYSCDASAGVVAIKVMVGEPQADSPSATGAQNSVTCDGSNQSTVVVLTGTGQGAPPAAGQTVQVRVALVDQTDTVISGQNKVVSLA